MVLAALPCCIDRCWTRFVRPDPKRSGSTSLGQHQILAALIIQLLPVTLDKWGPEMMSHSKVMHRWQEGELSFLPTRGTWSWSLQWWGATSCARSTPTLATALSAAPSRRLVTCLLSPVATLYCTHKPPNVHAQEFGSSWLISIQVLSLQCSNVKAMAYSPQFHALYSAECTYLSSCSCDAVVYVSACAILYAVHLFLLDLQPVLHVHRR